MHTTTPQRDIFKLLVLSNEIYMIQNKKKQQVYQLWSCRRFIFSSSVDQLYVYNCVSTTQLICFPFPRVRKHKHTLKLPFLLMHFPSFHPRWSSQISCSGSLCLGAATGYLAIETQYPNRSPPNALKDVRIGLHQHIRLERQNRMLNASYLCATHICFHILFRHSSR